MSVRDLKRIAAKAVGRVPLNAVLVVPFIVQIVGIVGIVGYLSFQSGKQAVNDLAAQLRQQISDRTDQKLDAYLSIPQQLNQINLDAIDLGLLQLDDFSTTGRYFFKQMRAFDIGYNSFGNPKGEFIGVERLDNGNLLINEISQQKQLGKLFVYATDKQGNRTRLLETKDYDPRKEAWYTDPTKAGKPLWSQIYQWEDKPEVLSISSSYPVYDRERQLVGVISIDLILSQIGDFLRQLKISPSAKTFIIERDGYLVATSASEDPFALKDGKATRIKASEGRDPLMRATAQFLTDHFGNLKQIEQSQFLDFYPNGEHQFVQVTPWQDKFGLDWLIVVVIPEADFMGQINANIRTTILLCFVALVIAIILGIVTSRWIIFPILRLKDAATALSKGEFNSTVNFDRTDELGILARAFNSMANQLQASFKTLESQNTELQRLDKLKDEFLANTSHELRTPLNGIIGLAESLIDGATGELPEQTKANLSMIVSSGRRLSNLVNDLLDFSRLRHKNIELQLKPVGLREITDLVLALSQPLIGKKSLQLINSINPETPLIFADENRLQQILYNLVGNAIKFTESGVVEVSAKIVSEAWVDLGNGEDGETFSVNSHQSTAISLRAGEQGSREVREIQSKIQQVDCTWRENFAVPRPQNPKSVRLSAHDEAKIETSKIQITVSDTGIGIPTEKFDRIFESFEQADGSTARQYGGTGLGLAVTKQLVELHGGEIRVTSTVGVGSQFTFTLPLLRDSEGKIQELELNAPTLVTETREVLPNRAVRSPLFPVESAAKVTDKIVKVLTDHSNLDNTQLKILIVDDEPINLQVLANNLLLENYAIAQASNGIEALELLDSGFKPDLILLDVMMPRMTGYEVCQKVREKFPAIELPIVMLTAKNQTEDLVQAFDLGANDYLTKPFVKNELLARIKTHIRLAKINAAYGRFVPHDFLNFLGRESIIDVKLGDHIQKEMTVLFADIRSFTTLSEEMSPEDNFNFLNSCLKRISPIIRDRNGFIDKYIGDAVMALFPRSADDAVSGAIEMQQQTLLYNEHRQRKGYVPISIGMGLHTGTLMLGTIGEEQRMEGTVISDAVNLASRLEGLTKLYGAGIVVSQATLYAIEDTQKYNFRFLDRVQVKGKNQAIAIFEIYNGDPDPLQALKKQTRTSFEQAVVWYYQQQFDRAEQLFRAILQLNPHDKAVVLYLARCERNKNAEMPTEWLGGEILDEK